MEFRIRARDTEGALERIMGRIRQRGYRISQFIATPSGTQHFEILLTVKSERRAELLVPQLEKLYDVEGVEMCARRLRPEIIREDAQRHEDRLYELTDDHLQTALAL